MGFYIALFCSVLLLHNVCAQKSLKTEEIEKSNLEVIEKADEEEVSPQILSEEIPKNKSVDSPVNTREFAPDISWQKTDTDDEDTDHTFPPPPPPLKSQGRAQSFRDLHAFVHKEKGDVHPEEEEREEKLEPTEKPKIDKECVSEAEVGLCRASKTRYYYNVVTKMCEKFIYGGCGGNGNNYLSLEDCEKECMPNTVFKDSAERS